MVAFHPSAEAEFDGKLFIHPFPSGAPVATIPLSGRSGADLVLAAGGDPLDFGTRPVLSTTHGTVVAMNLGSVTTSITGAIPAGPFSLAAPPATVELGPWASHAFDVVYAPPSVGTSTTSLAVTPAGGLAVTVGLTGCAGGVLAVAPADLSFGDVPLGSTVTLPLVVANLSEVAAIVVHAAMAVASNCFMADSTPASSTSSLMSKPAALARPRP